MGRASLSCGPEGHLWYRNSSLVVLLAELFMDVPQVVVELQLELRVAFPLTVELVLQLTDSRGVGRRRLPLELVNGTRPNIHNGQAPSELLAQCE
jgi:hypothetical protein